jgi:hypothetical protein
MAATIATTAAAVIADIATFNATIAATSSNNDARAGSNGVKYGI